MHIVPYSYSFSNSATFRLFGCYGFNETVGITVSSTKKATLIQHAIKQADSVTMVCLSRFFGVKSLYRVGNLNISHRVLTDSNLEDRYKNYIYNQNIPLFTSIDVYEN
jgi:DeoR/GlpR family transcriptional regulator of sugar metabolism